jgi:hypothetical protein
MLVEDISANKYFSRLEYDLFYYLCLFVTYLLTLSRTSDKCYVFYKPGNIVSCLGSF